MTATAIPRSGASVFTDVYRETVDSVVLVQTATAQGTGFVFDESHFVTNAHVVGDATSTGIRFGNGQWRLGGVVGVDAHSDLAAIAIDDRPAPADPLEFLQAEPVIGQRVVAIGNPYNLNGSPTTGVVNGTDRLFPSPPAFGSPTRSRPTRRSIRETAVAR